MSPIYLGQQCSGDNPRTQELATFRHEGFGKFGHRELDFTSPDIWFDSLEEIDPDRKFRVRSQGTAGLDFSISAKYENRSRRVSRPR
jgi:hypothetical protein